MTAAKGLAEATGKPAIGISNLRALASFGTAPLRNPVIDARRGQIYTAIYNSDLLLLSEEILTRAAEWSGSLDAEVIESTPPLASAIALCADLDGPACWRDPALLDAHYVRRSDAEMYWTDAHSR
jgi:tRNA threonylcarbamoyladenosine biosynthesis protein TsaB